MPGFSALQECAKGNSKVIFPAFNVLFLMTITVCCLVISVNSPVPHFLIYLILLILSYLFLFKETLLVSCGYTVAEKQRYVS